MTDSLATTAFTVEVVTTFEQVDQLSPEWSALLGCTPCGSGFQSLGWVRACWEHLAQDRDRLFVMIVRHRGDVVAIFPTKRSNGRLSFIDGGVSNYSGPLYAPGHVRGMVEAWLRFIQSTSEITSVDFSGLREGTPIFAVFSSLDIPRWGTPLISETNSCPEVDLTPGWDALAGRHKSKQRAGWRKKERRLASLGQYRFVETEDSVEIMAAMPRLSSMFRSRWEGQRISGGFARDFEQFHAATVRYSADERYIRLSMLILDGEIIAFSYGIRASNVTSSYFLAHDERFSPYSVGLLLVIRVLEAAAGRGDPLYDFSLGSAEYKALWATGERRVYRYLWGDKRWLRYLSSRAWVRARSVEWLRDLKRQGIGALRRQKVVPVPDSPGLSSGSCGRWYVYRVSPEASPTSWDVGRPYGYLTEHLSPRLVGLAIERNFRGDELIVADDESGLVGVVWRAVGTRRATVTADAEDLGDKDVVYYHPSVRRGASLEEFVMRLVPGEGSCVVVTNERLRPTAGVTYSTEFCADFSFAKNDPGAGGGSWRLRGALGRVGNRGAAHS